MSNLRKIVKKEKTICFLLLFFAAVLICIPLTNSTIDMTYDDGIQHICRLMGTEQSIQEGQPFATIMSEFCNGFGYSWNIFYSPLTSYGPLLFHWIGANFSTCIKWFMFVVTFLSGLTMFHFTKKITRNNKVATIAGILYLLAPYRLTDMYVRNALAELTSFVFLPMVFSGLYSILNEKQKKSYSLILGAVGLLLTHTVITLYTAIFSIIYIGIHFRKLKNKRIWRNLIVSTVFILLLTAFFWAPLWEHKQATDYEVFKPGRMERTEVLIAYKLDIGQLFYTPNNQSMIYELGMATIIGLMLCIPVIRTIHKKKHTHTSVYKTYLFMLIAGLVCCIMTLKLFPFEHLPATLKMLQFSFRLLEFSSFFFAFVVAINLGILAKKLKMTDILIVLGVCGVTVICLFGHIHYLTDFDESVLWPAVPVTAETGRVHAGCASFEYLPSKAFQHRDYIETRDQSVKILKGSTQIEEQHKEKAKMSFVAKFCIEETTLELPYIYYLGYEVTLQSDEKEQKLPTYETENGFVGITLPIVEEATITVTYTGTTVMKVSTIVSLLTSILFIGVLFMGKRKKRVEKKRNI